MGLRCGALRPLAGIPARLLRARPARLAAAVGLPLVRDVDHGREELGRRSLLLHLERGQGAAPDVLLVQVLAVGPAPRSALAPHEVEPGVHPAVEVVDGVGDERLEGHRLLGRAVLVPAVVGEDEVDHLVLEVAGDTHPPGLVVDPLGGHHEVADEAPLVRVLHLALEGELADLAEVVEEGAGDEQIAVHLRIVVGDPMGELEAAHGVLEQAARIGVVDALRRRGSPQPVDHVLVVEEGLDEVAHVGVGDGLDEREELLPERLLGLAEADLLGLLGLGRGREDELGGVKPGGGKVDLGGRLDAHLRLALEEADLPLDLDGVLLLEQRRQLLDLVEGAGLELPGLVVERDGQVRLAALGGGNGLARHEEQALHPFPFLHVLGPDLVHGSREASPSGAARQPRFRPLAAPPDGRVRPVRASRLGRGDGATYLGGEGPDGPTEAGT